MSLDDLPLERVLNEGEQTVTEWPVLIRLQDFTALLHNHQRPRSLT